MAREWRHDDLEELADPTQQIPRVPGVQQAWTLGWTVLRKGTAVNIMEERQELNLQLKHQKGREKNGIWKFHENRKLHKQEK